MGCDVIVAGGGPAGSAAAYVLAKAGADVTILERARFPRDKSCGDGITPHAIRILEDMGLAFESFEGRATKTFGGLISGPGGGTFCAKPPPGADGEPQASWVVPRRILDAALVRAAQRAGAKLREGTIVSSVIFDKGIAAGVEARDGNAAERVRARVVIGADGAHSAVARSLGIGDNSPRNLGYALRGYYENVEGLTDDLEIHYYEKELLPGYGWVFPVGPSRANVGVGIYIGELRRSGRHLRDILEGFLASVPAVAARFAGARQCGHTTGWPLPVSSANRRTVFDGAMLTGDAASLVDPLTGEGIYTALVSGRSAGRAALHALRTGNALRGALQSHEREWKSIAGGYLSSGRILKNLAKSARLFDLVVERAAANPYYASRAIGYGLGTLDRRRALRSIVYRALLTPRFFRRISGRTT
ncbi:MAG: geranylgeranyl reductase family protein [Candidatus Eremiobacteraeota bacterium]|nr:geranylgeranyl reductase family protein [Candidatus Eremiobacteraeota bacterium]MBC5826862.1 geranylgeranyl reductase family protein [Candidatus Eremiobacteraeota bacterium]